MSCGENVDASRVWSTSLWEFSARSRQERRQCVGMRGHDTVVRLLSGRSGGLALAELLVV